VTFFLRHSVYIELCRIGYVTHGSQRVESLCQFLSVPNKKIRMCLRLIIGILSLRTFVHLTVLSLSNPALNLTFSLLPITSSHQHASASDSTFDYWRYINIWLTLTFEDCTDLLIQHLPVCIRDWCCCKSIHTQQLLTTVAFHGILLLLTIRWVDTVGRPMVYSLLPKC